MDPEADSKMDPMASIICAQCAISWQEFTSFPDNSDLQCWAHFNDSDKNVFQYGLQGMLILESERIFEDDDYLCCTCLAQYKNHPYLGVQCANCSKFYRSFYYNEGFDCATNVLGDGLIPGYGSKYDMQQLSFIEGKFPAHLPKDKPNETLVCDSCIDSWIKNGSLQNHTVLSKQGNGTLLKVGPVPSAN